MPLRMGYFCLWIALFCIRSVIGGLAIRRMSAEDAKLWRGQLHRDPNASVPRHWIFIHIPKTAGASFMADSPRLLPRNSTLKGNNEQAWYKTTHLEKTDPGVALAVFLRHPLRHVASQFLECKYDGWGKRVTKGTGFPRGDLKKPFDGFGKWISKFLPQRSNRKPGKLFDYNCYNPWNMQARHMATGAGHHIAAMKLDPPLAVARTNVDSTRFVGLQDLYDESLCLFRFYATGAMPESCACGQGGAIRGHHAANRHGVPPHSLDAVAASVRRQVAKLVKVDAKLFLHAVGVFEKRLRQAQAQSGVKVVCEKRLDDLRREAQQLVKETGG